MKKREVRWAGPVGTEDDFGRAIGDTFIDGRTKNGQWAIMNLESARLHGARLGLGRGQLYKKQEDGTWLKVEG